MGDRKQYLQTALELLNQKWFPMEAVAPLYVSRALGFDGQEFYNTAIRTQTEMDTYELIACIRDIESSMGKVHRVKARKEEDVVYHDRPIDIDILLYDDMIFSNSDVTIPHRSIGQRDFVLAPILHLDSELRDPMSDELFADVLESLPEEEKTILDVIHDWYE